MQWDLTKPYQIMERLGFSNAKGSELTFSGDGQTLAWLDENGVLQRWRLTPGVFEPPLSAPGSHGIRSFAYQPGENRVALGLDDGSILIWDFEQGSALGPPIRAHAGAVTWLAFAPKGESFATSGCAGFETITVRSKTRLRCKGSEFRMWQVSDGTEVGTARPASLHEQLSYATRGDWSLAAAVKDLKLKSLEVSMQVVHPRNDILITGGCGNFDGNCRDGIIQFWDLAVGARDGPRLFGHNSSIRRIALSSDGRILATGDQNGSILLWDVGTRERLGPPMKGHRRRISGLSFSHDGNLLVSASEDAVVLWDLRFASLSVYACRTANRNFDEAEWRLRFDDDYRATCEQMAWAKMNSDTGEAR